MKKFFEELSRRLREGGVESSNVEDRRLEIFLHGQPVLFVSPGNDVFLFPAGSNNPEASELYHRVAQTADEVYTYVEEVQTAPTLHISGLSEKFHLLADFGGAVLAGRELENGRGYQFVTWIWDYNRTGVSYGHYYDEDFCGAKQDFAVRSGLISKTQLFSPEELTELYRATDYDEYVDEQIEASEVQSDLLPKSGKLVNLLSAYEELQQIPDEERITRLAPGAFGYCLDPNVPDERLHTAYQQALSALELESDEIQEAESFTSRDEIISRMRDCLLAKELTAGDKVLFVATEPYGGPGDFDLRGGVIESVDEKDKTCSVRGTFFTMEKVPLHYVLGRYNPAVGEEHYGVRGIVPFFCEDKELAGYYLNEVRTMWDVEMGEEQDLSM